MGRIYERMIDLAGRAGAWLDSHRDLGGRILAPACLMVFIMVGFWFLLRSLGII